MKKVKCEDCHISVKRLVQGKGGIGVKERPSRKLDVVECIDCHRGVPENKKDTIDAIKKTVYRMPRSELWEKVCAVESDLRGAIEGRSPRSSIRSERRSEGSNSRGGHTFVYRKLFGEAEFNFNLAKNGNGVHNLEYTKELIDFATHKLDEAIKQIAKKKREVAQGRM